MGPEFQDLVNTLIEPLIKTALGVLGTALAGILVMLAKRGLERLGLSVNKEQEAQLEHAVRQAILRAEELAAKALRERTTRLSGPDKRKLVVHEIQQAFPDLEQAEIERHVHAQLPQVGVGASAALSR